jgi:hypothetical protein
MFKQMVHTESLGCRGLSIQSWKEPLIATLAAWCISSSFWGCL